MYNFILLHRPKMTSNIFQQHNTKLKKKKTPTYSQKQIVITVLQIACSNSQYMLSFS